MRRLLLLALGGFLLILLLHWSESSKHELPKWLWGLFVGGYFLLSAVFDDDSEQHLLGRFGESLAIVYMLGASLFAIFVGIAALSLQGSGSLLEIFWFALPGGLLMLVAVLAKMWLDSR